MRVVTKAMLASLFVVTLVACGSGDETEPTQIATQTAAPSGPAEDPTPLPTSPEEPPAIAELALSVVQIVVLDARGEPVWHGSGTVVHADGFILTNAHVVDDRLGEYSQLTVAVTNRTDTPPVPSFIAEIAAVDYTTAS